MAGTYDPQEHDCIIGGSQIVGYADGTFIKAAYNEDQWSLKVGADGFFTRVRNANRSARFEVTLMASSPSNDRLAAINLSDSAGGNGVVPVIVKDRGGNAVAAAQKAWIIKMADIERGKELPDVTWTLETGFADIVQGGTDQST